MTRSILLALLATPLLGCSLSGLAARAPGTHPPAAPLPTPALPAGHVTDIVTWALAIVVGSLVLAFAAKILNGRQKTTPGIPTAQHKEP